MSRNVGAYDSLIPMPKDGEPGTPGVSPLLFGALPSSIPVLVDAETGLILENVNVAVTVFVQRGDSRLSPLDVRDAWSVSFDTDFIHSFQYSKEDCTLYIRIVEGTASSRLGNAIELEFFFDNDEDTIIGKTSITINKSQRGTTGPQGKTIPQPYDCGWWDIGTSYVVRNNYAPMVAFPKVKDPQFYVRTENALVYGSDGRPLDPATDYATYVGKGAWLLFEKYAAILVQLLMANWARFGSLEGGVFWEHYLFSALGKPAGSDTAVNYSDYVDSSSPIFDEETRELTGIFTPNLLIDFKNGRIYCKDVDITGIVNATDGTFRGEVNIARGKILFNRDGSGSIAGKGLVWDSVGDMHQAYGMQPLWLSVQKAITLKDRFLYMSAYGGHMLDVLLGVYFNTQWDVTTAGDNCHQYLLLPTPQSFTSLGTIEEIYIKISKRELFFFWFKSDDVSDSFYIKCHKDGFIRLRKNSGEITSLKKGDFLMPKEGVICKFEYTGTYWFGEYMDFGVFILS